jgi:hypothetical protein
MKALLFLISAALIATPALAQQQPAQPQITITLTPQQLEVIGTALDEIPGKYGRPVYENLSHQIAAAQAKHLTADKPPMREADKAASKAK